MIILCLLTSAGLAAQTASSPAVAAVPRLVRVTGVFRPSSGLPVGPSEGVTLAVYRDETGGTPLWQETQNAAVDPDGRYTVLLGASRNDGVPLDLFAADEPRWLGALFLRPGEVEQPRMRLTSVPYALKALKASDADTLGGRPASAYVLASAEESGRGPGTPLRRKPSTSAAQPVPFTSGTPGYLGKFTSSTDLGNSVAYETGGFVGFGTTVPRDRVSSVFNDSAGVLTGFAVQNTSSGAAAYSGMLFYDQNGALGQFQGFNNSTHEYRINNIASGGTINFMIGSSSKFYVGNNGNIGVGTSTPAARLEVAGTLKAAGFAYPDGSQQTTAQSAQAIALLRWYGANQTTQFSAGTAPKAVVFDGQNIWVANSGSNNVTKLRASDGENLGTFAAGTGPSWIAFDGANVWVVNGGSNNVTKLRATDGANQGTFAVGTAPSGAAFDGTYIWVANPGSNNVTRLRASDGSNQGTFSTGANPRGVAFDGTNVWLANNGGNTVTKLRASDGALQGTFNVGTNPNYLAFDGANIWVSNGGSNNVTKLRASDGALQGTFNVGSVPVGLAFDGANIWVANNASSNVTKLQASDGASTGPFAAGAGPWGLAFDGANIWVANSGGSTVSKL